MVNAFVYLVDLPSKVKGFTVPDVNDDYTVYINKHLCYEQMLKTYWHELNHIFNGDFEKHDVQEIELFEH